MSRFARITAVMSLLFFGSTAAAACVVPSNGNELATEIAAGVNASGQSNGERPLRYNRELGRAAMNTPVTCWRMISSITAALTGEILKPVL
jgi:hypothetical protein